MANRTDRLQQLESIKQINTVSDTHRLEILRLLMTTPSTISQIGRQLGEYPAAVRYHINKLEAAGLVELSEVRDSPGYTEKYYSAKADALLIQRTILPLTDKKSIIFMGSHDLAWEKIIHDFCDNYPKIRIFNFPIGSLDGLIALRQGTCQLAGCHLLDSETQQYNRPYVKHLFPGQNTQLVTLANRIQGLLFSQENPKGISSLNDLSRSDIRFVNRNPGSGTRIWLDNKMAELGISSHRINGYTKEVNSHTAVAREIKLGHVDLGIGLIAAAGAEHLESIPLFEEQYDLVIPGDYMHDFDILAILDHLTDLSSRNTIRNLPGYDADHTGDSIEVKQHSNLSRTQNE
jgi:molybdate-binding protein